MRRRASWLARVQSSWQPSITTRLALLSLATVLIGALGSAIFFAQARANLEAQVLEDQAALARSYGRMVQEYLNGSTSVLQGLAQTPAVRAPLDKAAIRPQLHGLRQAADQERRATIEGTISGSGRVQSVIVLAPDGDVYLVEPYALQPGFGTLNLGGSPTVQRALLTGESAWSDVIVDAATQKPTVVIEIPITSAEGHVESLLGSSLGLDGLSEAAHALQTERTGTLMLFDSEGVPIVYPDPDRVSARQSLTEQPLVGHALNGELGSFVYDNPLTRQNELGTSVVLDNGWFAVVTLPETRALEGLNQIVTAILLVLATGVTALLGMGFLLARSISRSLGEVARAATGLAAGDLDQHVRVSSKDELGQMANAVREVIAYQQQMAAVAGAISQGDLTGEIRPKSERDVLGIAFARMSLNLRTLIDREQHARTDAERAVLLRDQVLQTISHDLMNPLAGIMAQAQLLIRRVVSAGAEPGDPLVKGLLDISVTVRRATDDVEELVDASRLQVGRLLELHRTPVDLVALVERVVVVQRALTATPLHVDPQVDQLVGWWDERRLVRVLSNLLSNAVKYSPNGALVTITLGTDHADGMAWAVLAIRDCGIGIPQADLPHIFEWFHRAQNVGSVPGTGIGLASVHQIVRQHGGTLDVASQQGAGSTFTLRLPLAHDQGRRPPAEFTDFALHVPLLERQVRRG